MRRCVTLTLSVCLVAGVAAQPSLTFVEHLADGVGGVDGLDGAFRVAVSPDGDHVYVASGGDAVVAVFSRDATTGRLAAAGTVGAAELPGLTDPAALAVSPDGAHVYIGDFPDRLVVASRDATTGGLTHVQTLTDAAVDGLAGVIDVKVSSDGTAVFAVGLNDDALVAFSRNATTGELTFVDRKGTSDAVNSPFGVSVSPDGSRVYVANANGGFLAGFTRASDGTLTLADTPTTSGSDSPQDVAFSTDGDQLYAANSGFAGVTVLERGEGTDFYSTIQTFDGSDSPAVESSWAVVVSPDGRAVYAGGSAGVAVAFARDVGTGELTVADDAIPGQEGVEGPNTVWDLALSPDGQFLYAVGSGGSGTDGIVVLSTAVSTASEGDPAAAGTLAVSPNPAVAGARVRFVPASPGPVEIALYDVTGRRSAVLFSGPAASGEPVEARVPALAAGVYVVRARAAGAVVSRRLALVR